MVKASSRPAAFLNPSHCVAARKASALSQHPTFTKRKSELAEIAWWRAVLMKPGCSFRQSLAFS